MASGPWAVSPLLLRRVAAAASAIALCATLALVATGGREPTASEMSWFDPQWSNQAHGVAQAGRAGDRLPSRLQGSLLQMLGQLDRVTRTEAPLFRREERAAPTHGGRQEQLAQSLVGLRAAQSAVAATLTGDGALALGGPISSADVALHDVLE